jgi:hypothetical protein
VAKFGIQIQIVFAGAADAQAGLRGVGGAAGASAQEVADLKEKVSELSTELADLKEKSDASGESIGSMKDVLGELGVVTTAIAAFALMADTMKGWVADAAEVERISTQLDVKVRATGEGAGWTAGQLDTMAQQLEAGSRFTEPMIKGAENLLLSFTNIKGENFPAALQAIANVAANTGGDMQGMALKIGIALDNPAQALGRLRKAGIDFDAQQQEQIKTMAQSGDIAGAQAMILAGLSRYQGAAAADAQTLSGQWAMLGRDFTETGGKILVGMGVFDAVKAAVHAMASGGKADMLELAAGAEQMVGYFLTGLASMVTGIGDFIAGAMRTMTQAFAMQVAAIVSAASEHPNIAKLLGFTPDVIAEMLSWAGGLVAASSAAQTFVTGATGSVAGLLKNAGDSALVHADALDRAATETAKLGESSKTAADANHLGALSKAQKAFNDQEEKAVELMQAKLAKATQEADDAVAGAGAVKLHTAALAADAEVAKLRDEARLKSVGVNETELKQIHDLGVAIDSETTRKQLNILVSKQREEDEKIAAATLAKVTDAENQNTTASVIAAAVSKERAAILATTVPIESAAAVALLSHAEAEGRASAMALGYVAAIKEEQAQVVAMRAAQAALMDEVTRSNTASIAAAQLTKAEAEARKEGYTEDNAFEALAFQARVRDLVQHEQVLQGVKDEGVARKELNAIYDSGVQSAIDTTAQLLAQLGVYSQINPQVGALASRYQSLFSAEGYVAYQELLLQAIRKQGIDLATQEGQLKAQLLAADLAGVSQQIQAYKQLDAVLQQRATDEKAIADGISKDWEGFFQGFAEQTAGMAVNWTTTLQGMEKSLVDSLANMLAHAAETNLVQAIFGQGATLQTALFGGGPGAGANVQFQSAVTQFGAFVAQLSGSSLLGAGGALGTAGGQLSDSVVFLKDAGTNLTGAADAQQEFAKFASGAFGANSQYFTANSQNFDASAFQLDAAATNLSASGAGGSGGSGLLGSAVSAFGGGLTGLVYVAAAAFAGWVLYNVIAGWASQAGPDPNKTFGPAMGYGGASPVSYTGTGQVNVGLGAAGGGISSFDAQSQQVVQALQAFFVGFEKATGQIIQSLPAIAIQVSANGLMFQATVGHTIIGTFTSMQQAIDHAIAVAFSVANLGDLPQVIQDYVKNLTGTVDPNVILSNVQVLEQVIDGAHGAISKITTDMKSYVATAMSEDTALVNMGLSLADLKTMLGDVNSGLVALDTQERDSIIGKKLTAKQQQELDRETFNNALALQEAQIQQQIIQLQVEALGIAGQGAYINGLGLVARATVDSAGIQAKSAGVIDQSNKLLLDSINQAIQSDQDLLKQLAGLTIKPGDLRAPGGSGTASTLTTVASALQTLQAAALALAQYGLSPWDAGMLKIEEDTKRQEKGLKASSQAYKDLEQAEADQIALLRKQTQATIDGLVTPLIQQAHGMSAFAVALAASSKQFDDAYAEAKKMGDGEAELGRIRRAQLQAEANLVMQYVGALSLPLDATRANADKFSLAVQALNQGLKDGAVSSAQFASEMAQIRTQGTSDILTMIEGIYNAVGDTADAEKVKQELQQITFEIQLAQLQEETDILLANGVISQALADRVAGIEAYFAGHPVDWAAVNAPHTAATSSAASAANSLASALQSAVDALKKFDQSLDLNAQLSPLTAQQKEDAAMLAYQQDLARAQRGDVQAITDLPNIEQALLTQARAFYGSESPYTDIYNEIRRDNAGIIGGGGYVNSPGQAQSLGYTSTYALPPPPVVAANAAPVVGAVQAQAASAAKDAADISRKLDQIGTVVTAVDNHRRQAVTDTAQLSRKLDALIAVDQTDQGQMARLLGLLERRAS